MKRISEIIIIIRLMLFHLNVCVLEWNCVVGIWHQKVPKIMVWKVILFIKADIFLTEKNKTWFKFLPLIKANSALKIDVHIRKKFFQIPAAKFLFLIIFYRSHQQVLPDMQIESLNKNEINLSVHVIRSYYNRLNAVRIENH